MKTKMLSMRLSDEMRTRIDNSNKSVTDYITDAVNTMEEAKRYAMYDIKGIFAPDEWKFLVDITNGYQATGNFKYSPSALVASCEDAEKFDGTAQRWGIDLITISDKIRSLTSLQVWAIHTRLADFWAASGQQDLDDFCRF